MPVTNTIYTTKTLLGVMEEQEPPSNYWLDLCFPRALQFTTEWVEFEKLTDRRRLAPYALPGAPGIPTYSARGSTVKQFKPAYIKPKDPVYAAEQMARKPGNLVGPARTPGQNFDAAVGEITRFHRTTIERRWEYMAAQAILNGTITIAGDDVPTTTLDFDRAGNHTVTLAAGSRWGDTGVSIVSNIETWVQRMRRAEFGGAPTRLTVGSDVWTVMRRDPELLEQLDTTVRGTDANFRTGPREMLDVEFVGRIGNLDIWVYSDYYETNDGTLTPFMDSRDIVLTSPAVDGVRAFGAILDKSAGFAALPIFPKMWDNEDPSATYIMSQSAPLMVPVNPNATLRARVIA